MRKKTINCLYDNSMWYCIYLLPLALFVGVSIKTGQFVSLASCFESVGLSILTDNIILTTLSSLFGTGGVLPLFASPDILIYFTYFVSVYLMHLCVDFLLFIPRLSHKWLKSFTSGGAE